MVIVDTPKHMILCLGFVILVTGCQKPKQSKVDIMSFDEYAKTPHQTPYVLNLSGADWQLFYFGSRHSNDPEDPMFDEIERYFLQVRPRIAFNEGGDPPTKSERHAAIQYYGEPGFLRHLGSKHGVPVFNLDPSIEDEVRHLASLYTKEQLLLYYVLRQLRFYNSMKYRPQAEQYPEFEQYFDRILTKYGRALELPNAGWSLVKTEFNKTFGRSLNVKEIDNTLTDPVFKEHITQRISRESSAFRDRQMVETLVEAVRTHRRVFAVMGASHVVMQEAALRFRLQEL
jgi:hypothetical protein